MKTTTQALTETDTCRELVTPKLVRHHRTERAGPEHWGNDALIPAILERVFN